MFLLRFVLQASTEIRAKDTTSADEVLYLRRGRIVGYKIAVDFGSIQSLKEILKEFIDACERWNPIVHPDVETIHPWTHMMEVPQGYASSYTYNTLMDMYGKAGQLQDASDAFSRMLRE
ncbi:hypothetical protein IFM89_000172 [Coptis chinensis]|uniref:Pentatricopeptide repeat-containing protein n=1 Tax=Coptis chinensis TaxID=261450 RepID=A0A835H1K8_9MAGN|nr:hypothetical protein IFM89_000172 [Coptis chinensis]